jgi:hypothetical protein
MFVVVLHGVPKYGSNIVQKACTGTSLDSVVFTSTIEDTPCNCLNLLMSSGWFKYHIAFMCFVRISERTRTLFYTAIADSFCITEVQSVYCAVRAESYTANHGSSLRTNSRPTDYIFATPSGRRFIGLHYTI